PPLFFPFLFAGDRGERGHRALLPGFVTRARLLALAQFEQTRGPSAKIDIVAGGELLRLLEKAVLIRGVENLFPLEMLFSRQQEWNRFVMGIDRKEKGIVAYRFTVLADKIGGIAADQHSETTDERGIPFFFAHFVA